MWDMFIGIVSGGMRPVDYKELPDDNVHHPAMYNAMVEKLLATVPSRFKRCNIRVSHVQWDGDRESPVHGDVIPSSTVTPAFRFEPRPSVSCTEHSCPEAEFLVRAVFDRNPTVMRATCGRRGCIPYFRDTFSYPGGGAIEDRPQVLAKTNYKLDGTLRVEINGKYNHPTLDTTMHDNGVGRV